MLSFISTHILSFIFYSFLLQVQFLKVSDEEKIPVDTLGLLKKIIRCNKERSQSRKRSGRKKHLKCQS